VTARAAAAAAAAARAATAAEERPAATPPAPEGARKNRQELRGAEAPKDREWSCPFCTCLNPITSKICQACARTNTAAQHAAHCAAPPQAHHDGEGAEAGGRFCWHCGDDAGVEQTPFCTSCASPAQPPPGQLVAFCPACGKKQRQDKPPRFCGFCTSPLSSTLAPPRELAPPRAPAPSTPQPGTAASRRQATARVVSPPPVTASVAGGGSGAGSGGSVRGGGGGCSKLCPCLEVCACACACT
jgi:hypothetical protein